MGSSLNAATHFLSIVLMLCVCARSEKFRSHSWDSSSWIVYYFDVTASMLLLLLLSQWYCTACGYIVLMARAIRIELNKYPFTWKWRAPNSRINAIEWEQRKNAFETTLNSPIELIRRCILPINSVVARFCLLNLLSIATICMMGKWLAVAETDFRQNSHTTNSLRSKSNSHWTDKVSMCVCMGTYRKRLMKLDRRFAFRLYFRLHMCNLPYPAHRWKE